MMATNVIGGKSDAEWCSSIPVLPLIFYSLPLIKEWKFHTEANSVDFTVFIQHGSLRRFVGFSSFRFRIFVGTHATADALTIKFSDMNGTTMASPSCKPEWTLGPGGNNCYKFIPSSDYTLPSTWFQAGEQCALESSYTVMPKSAAQQVNILNISFWSVLEV